MIRICLNIKSQRTKEFDVCCKETDDSKNLRRETLYTGDYEYVNISGFAFLGIKLWLEEDGDFTLFHPGFFVPCGTGGGHLAPPPLVFAKLEKLEHSNLAR